MSIELVWAALVALASMVAAEQPKGPAVPELTRPIKLDDLTVWRDGGSLGFKLSGANGQQVAFCYDGRPKSPTAGSLFLNVTHPTQDGGQKLDVGSDAELKLLSYLQSWVRSSFTAARRIAIFQEKEAGKLAKDELSAQHVMRLIDRQDLRIIQDAGERRAQADLAKGPAPPLPGGASLLAVRPTDAGRAVVDAEVARLTATDDSAHVFHVIARVGKIEAAAIQRLFPNWDFYRFEYANLPKEAYCEESVAVFGGYTLAVARGGSGTNLKLTRYGDGREYADLLKRSGVVIRDAADAQLVWDAFCELFLKAWKDRPVERVSDSEWKLGVFHHEAPRPAAGGKTTILKSTVFYKVLTEPGSDRVTAWQYQSVVESSEKLAEPRK